MRRKRKQRPPSSNIRSVVEFSPHLLYPLTIDCQVPGVHNPATGSTFEDVLYAQDSESEVEDDGGEGNTRGRKKRGDVRGGVRLRIDNDQPMDLLESAATQVTSELSHLLPNLFNT